MKTLVRLRDTKNVRCNRFAGTGAAPSARQRRQIIRNSSEKVLDEVQITGMTNAFQIWPSSSLKPSFSTEGHLPLNNVFSLTRRFLPTPLLQQFNPW